MPLKPTINFTFLTAFQKYPVRRFCPLTEVIYLSNNAMVVRKCDTEIQGQTQHFNTVNKQNEVMKVKSKLKKGTGYTH